ncbi:hypothetical protein [Ligilactobacillus acidipiscis]|uniref:Uncharacterized protein n=1 Tax=Ligilactobacillus acidipiscis TaxID=89059 RepID=A0A1K1KNV7_9LACO|nr:hypothetical protein [Ligilactobacillus acidipiscis]SFV40571.1 hypothetical protein LAC1533_1151 [Ligilactobacillus acidipiscis]
MVKFTQAQKNEFDKLYTKRNSMTLLDVLQEVQRNELGYPVLYLYLFSGENDCANQDNFAKVWLDPSLITIKFDMYYLVLFPQMYIALDPDGKVEFTQKWDFSIAYQKKFTQVDIDQMQQRDEFKNRISLNACKVEVEADDVNYPPEVDTDDSGDDSEDVDDSTTDDDSVASDGSDDDPKVDEAVADESELKG